MFSAPTARKIESRVLIGEGTIGEAYQGERPTCVRNKDPLKPLTVPGKFLRPIIDPERAPPRPKDGIGM